MYKIVERKARVVGIESDEEDASHLGDATHLSMSMRERLVVMVFAALISVALVLVTIAWLEEGWGG